MTHATRYVVASLVLVCGMSACATKTPPATTPATPQYADFVFPGLPQELAAESSLATRHMQAWNRLQAGDLRGAERDFRWVTQRNPAYFPAETGLGDIALARKDYKQALDHFEVGLAVSPRYAPALVGRGDALQGLGRPTEAIVNYENALAADPSLTALRGRIDALRFKALEDEVAAARRARDGGRLDEAIAAYQRAITASPQSGFLYRELASVEQQSGKPAEALQHAHTAATLDPSDARAHVIAGDILQSQRNYAGAIEEYEKAASIEPSPDTAEKIEDARNRAELAALPPEYHAIPNELSVTRGELAALIGVRLEDLLERAPRRLTPVMTDTQESWAAPWIASVVRAGIMDPFPNHTFQPTAVVRRSDLASALARLLPMAAGDRPQVLAKWREARPTLSDVPPYHLVYPDAALTVEAGVLPLLDGGAFAPGHVVTGAEAIAALDRLEDIRRGKR